MPLAPQTNGWTAERFFHLLSKLGALRVISVCGPSVFEAICEFGDFEIRGGMLNAITPVYHWHFQLSRFRHLHSHDTVHKRSGRRVLFFELREQNESSPFLLVYLYRPTDAEFEPDQEKYFAEAHAELGSGVALEKEMPK